jgi:hypothetical protein
MEEGKNTQYNYKWREMKTVNCHPTFSSNNNSQLPAAAAAPTQCLAFNENEREIPSKTLGVYFSEFNFLVPVHALPQYLAENIKATSTLMLASKQKKVETNFKWTSI